MDLKNLTLRIKSCIACNENQCPEIRQRLQQHALTHQPTSSVSGPSLSCQCIGPTSWACNEDQCPVMKQRLDSHILSHHSNSRTISKQSDKTSSGTNITRTTSITPSIAIVNSDEQTSTADVAIEELKPQTAYREALEKEIITWAEELPKYPNPSDENLKQNFVRELINKVDSLYAEVNDDFYIFKLRHEINKFLDLLPPNPYVNRRDSKFESLRQKLTNMMCELNKQMIHTTKNTNNFVRENANRNSPIINDSNADTKLLNNKYWKNNVTSLRKNETKTVGTNASFYTFYDRYLTSNKPEFYNKSDNKFIDAEVQNSFHSIRPYYGQIYGQPNLKINKQLKTELNEDVCKEKISTWLIQVIQKSERNIYPNDKNILADVLFNRLRPLLTKNMYSSRYKLLLKAEILNFLYDYFMVAVAANGTFFNKLVENLAITLLTVKANSEALHSRNNTHYSYYCIEQRIANHVDKKNYLKSIINKIVINALENVSTYSENVKNDIADILLYNIDRIRLGSREDIKNNLHVLLSSSTNLHDIIIDSMLNNVLDYLTDLTHDTLGDYDQPIQRVEIPSWCPILSIYKSELDIHNPPEVSMQSLQQYSDIVTRNNPKLITKEKEDKERLFVLIAAWVKTLPKKHGKSEDMIIKNTIINSLVVDIMDQIKLEIVVPVTVPEKEILLSFFTYRWLNKVEYFENLNDAKPYVDKLIDKLIDISPPVNGSQQIHKINKFMNITCYQTTLVPENILENEILMIINAQPSKIFINADREIRKQQVHELAINIKTILMDSPKDITTEIIHWLERIIKQNNKTEKQNFDLLKVRLIERIHSLVQKRNLNDYEEGQPLQETKYVEKTDKVTSTCCELNEHNIYNFENTFKELIKKYLKHNYDVGNLIARETFGEIFKIELQKLSSSTNNNSTQNNQTVISTADTLSRELKYIMIICDWIKTLLLPITFYRTKSRVRIEFVHHLAKNLCDVEQNPLIELTEIKYEICLASVINSYVVQLIPTYHNKNMSAVVDDLVKKIMGVYQLPCCQLTNCVNNKFSINKTNKTDEELYSFIEKYVRENCEELSDDELKLETISARLFKEIDKLGNENPVTFSEANDYVELVKRLSFEFAYATEIADYLNNLPLLLHADETFKDYTIKMISKLAEKMYERWKALYEHPNNTTVNTILSEYIMQWISKLPLDTSKEIDGSIITQQLLKRMERVNKRKLNKQQITGTDQEKKSNEMCKLPYTCCYKNKTKVSDMNHDLGTAIVEDIEKWCVELPVQTEDETHNNIIKNHIAANILKKICELNMNPKSFTDKNLYQELLADEVDNQLSNLPNNSLLQSRKDDLKQQLLSKIMGKKIEIREHASSTEYKQELERIIDLSLQNPIQTYQEESPGFKIYKDRLVSLFILENFDHCYDNVKVNYKIKIKKELDKYFHRAQKTNAILLPQDQFHNELNSALFKAPLPSDASITEEVEEIKTRCEIDNWFKTLPLRAASSDIEILARDQIIATLAKRIHKIEKYEQNPENKIQREIVRWLSKLPLLQRQENSADEIARKLLQILKSTLKNRRCTHRYESVNIDRFITNKNKKKTPKVLETHQNPGPSRTWPCPASPTCCQIPPLTPKNPADIIINIVEMWCQQLPLPVNTAQDKKNTKLIKENLVVKIIMKISELNVNPQILNNDFLYDALLDDELDNVSSSLPTTDEFDKSINLRKKQLKDAIKSVKPLIQKEKSKYDYRKQLQNVVQSFLKEPQNLISKIRALYDTLQDDIINNFILHSYLNNDEECNFYKILVNVAVEKYFTDVCRIDPKTCNPLMVTNHLFCEMAKVPVPSKAAIIEVMREIQMKIAVTDFFNNESICNHNDKLLKKNQVISTLCKRLGNLEQTNNTLENFNKMKNVIMKYLNKLDENIEEQKLDALVQSLQNIPEAGTSDYFSTYIYPLPTADDDQSNDQSHMKYTNNENNQTTEDKQWMSLLSVTPKTSDERNMTTQNKNSSGYKQTSQFNDEEVNYSNFKKGVVLNSSLREDQKSNDEKYFTLESDRRTNSACESEVPGQPVSKGSDQLTSSFIKGPENMFPKLSEEGSTFVQDINMQQSNSSEYSNKANDQQSFRPAFTFRSPIRQPFNHESKSGQVDLENQIQSNPSMIDNRAQFPSFKQNHIHNENMMTHHKIPQQEFSGNVDPQEVTKKEQTLMRSNTDTNETFSSDRPIENYLKPSIRMKKTKQIETSDKPLHGKMLRFPHRSSSVTRASKSPVPIKSVNESNAVSIPSNSSSAIQAKASDSNIRSRRRSSFLILNPSGSKSAQCIQTVEKNLSSDQSSLKEHESNKCSCEKRKRVCKSESQSNCWLKPVCRAHMKKRCKICKVSSPFCCKMPPCHYPGFYYY